jgi:general secretion pathway protein G
LKKTDTKNEAENAPEDKAETAKKMITLLDDALEVYRLDTGKYPSTLHCLEKNIDDDPRWDGPYIKPNVPLDPWGNAYQYSFDAEKGTYRLTSSGLTE